MEATTRVIFVANFTQNMFQSLLDIFWQILTATASLGRTTFPWSSPASPTMAAAAQGMLRSNSETRDEFDKNRSPRKTDSQ